MTDRLFINNGTTFEEVNPEYIINLNWESNGVNSLDKLSVTFDKAILDTSYVPAYHTEIRFQNDNEFVFGGRVSIPSEQFGLYDVTCYSYGEEFLDRIVNEIYENLDVADIVEDLINNYTDLTYVGVASTGITIDRIVFRDRPLSDVFQFLTESLFYAIFTNYLKQADFRPIDESDTGLTLDAGVDGNILFPVIWDRNSNDVVTKLILEGDFETFNTSQSFSATSQSEFVLIYEPVGNILVTLGGIEQVGQVSGTNVGNYTVERENKKIIFNSAVTGTVVVSYEFLRPIRIESQVELLDNFGNRIEKERFLKKKLIKTYDAGREFAQKYLNVFGVPNLSGNPTIQNYNANIRTGRTITVVDSQNNVNDVLSVDSFAYNYPSLQTTINVGRRRKLIWDWQKEAMQRIEEGAKKDINVDILQNYVKVSANIKTELEFRDYNYERRINDSWIWGKSIWGTDKWGDRRDGDTFDAYISGTQLTSFWEVTGTAITSGGVLELNSGSEIKYLGRDEAFELQIGKAIIEFDSSVLGSLNIKLRQTNNNDITINLQNTELTVLQNISASQTELLNITGLTLSGNEILTCRLFDELRIYTESNSINATVDSITWDGTGSFSLESLENLQKIHKVSLYKGI